MEENLSIVDEKFEVIEEKQDKITGRLEELERRMANPEFSITDDKFVTIEAKLAGRLEEMELQIADTATFATSAEPILTSFQPSAATPAAKLSTFDGKTAWSVYRTQFELLATANNWDTNMKAYQLAAALRGEAATRS